MFFSVCFVLSSLTVWGAFVSGIIVSLCFVVCFVLSSLTVGGAFVSGIIVSCLFAFWMNLCCILDAHGLNRNLEPFSF